MANHMEPIFTMNDAGRGRRPRILLRAVMLALLVAVLFAAYQILPLGESGSSRALAKAARYERRGNHKQAAVLYQKILENEKVRRELRAKAGYHLAAINQNRFKDYVAAWAAMNKADSLVAPAARESLRHGIQGLPAPADRTTTGSVPAESLPFPEATVIARVGGETVTLEEVLYAWSQFYGSQPPTSKTLQPFVDRYLDMTLLADEAHRRELDRKGRGALDLRLKRIIGLNQALSQEIIEKLPDPTEDEVKAYYEKHKKDFGIPARAVIGHVVVGDEEGVKSVRRALREDQNFNDIARLYSLDAKQLPEGYLLGEITAGNPEIPIVGPLPGVVDQLMMLDDGRTTGPVRSMRGWHWFKVVRKSPEQQRSYDEVREDVIYKMQVGAWRRQQAELLKQLKETRASEIETHPDRLHSAMQARAAQQPARMPTVADRAATTATQPTSAPLTADTNSTPTEEGGLD